MLAPSTTGETIASRLGAQEGATNHEPQKEGPGPENLPPELNHAWTATSHSAGQSAARGSVLPTGSNFRRESSARIASARTACPSSRGGCQEAPCSRQLPAGRV